MKKDTLLVLTVLLYLYSISTGCAKYLDERPNKKMVIISSVKDLQALMDSYSWVNASSAVGEEGGDNYYLTEAEFAAAQDYNRNMYTWNAEQVFADVYSNAWGACYDNVYRANTVLFNIEEAIDKDLDNANTNNIKGQAYFLRGSSFLFAVTVWSLAYDEQTAGIDLGIPLRLTPDFNEIINRATVRETYSQVISDLKNSIALLPVDAGFKMRASRPMACALLARAYLYMRQYDSSYVYANKCLQMQDSLVDFNTLNANDTYPFQAIAFEKNPELLYYNRLLSGLIYSRNVDSLLYKSYEDGDLRKSIYFTNTQPGIHYFKGSVLGSSYSGSCSLNEMYLTRAECLIRLGKQQEGLDDLNALLVKRWKKGAFQAINAASEEQALKVVLTERRKELAFTGMRWMDIKRLNKEGANIHLRRLVAEKEYVLPPNDLRFAMAIPESVIKISGIIQNPR